MINLLDYEIEWGKIAVLLTRDTETPQHREITLENSQGLYVQNKAKLNAEKTLKNRLFCYGSCDVYEVMLSKSG